MKLKSATLKNFKRFTHLTVRGVSETVRLIMFAGPNGCGKSSFFDALYTWHGWSSQKKSIMGFGLSRKDGFELSQPLDQSRCLG